MAERRFELTVSGLEISATLSEASERAMEALIDGLIARKEHGGRLVAFLAGPPGAGKSTLSLILEALAASRAPGLLQALPMDGFHYPARYIESHTVVRDGEVLPMARVKGSPETFDLAALADAIRALKAGLMRWPTYDRRLHDVVDGAISVTGEILVVEGNWLLLDEPGYARLREACDYAIALWADEVALRDRLIRRKVRGCATEAEARAHYERCDRPNIRRYLAHSARGDVNFRVLGDGAYAEM
jgi:pantothenate kinase